MCHKVSQVTELCFGVQTAGLWIRWKQPHNVPSASANAYPSPSKLGKKVGWSSEFGRRDRPVVNQIPSVDSRAWQAPVPAHRAGPRTFPACGSGNTLPLFGDPRAFLGCPLSWGRRVAAAYRRGTSQRSRPGACAPWWDRRPQRVFLLLGLWFQCPSGLLLVRQSDSIFHFKAFGNWIPPLSLFALNRIFLASPVLQLLPFCPYAKMAFRRLLSRDTSHGNSVSPGGWRLTTAFAGSRLSH